MGARGGPGTAWAPAAPSPGVWGRLWAPRGSGGGEPWAGSGLLDAGLISRGDGPSEPAPAPQVQQPLGSQPGARPPRPAPLIPPPPRPPTPRRVTARAPAGPRDTESTPQGSLFISEPSGLSENQLCSQRNQQKHRASKSRPLVLPEASATKPPTPHPRPQPALPPTGEQNTRPQSPSHVHHTHWELLTRWTRLRVWAHTGMTPHTRSSEKDTCCARAGRRRGWGVGAGRMVTAGIWQGPRESVPHRVPTTPPTQSRVAQQTGTGGPHPECRPPAPRQTPYRHLHTEAQKQSGQSSSPSWPRPWL